MSAVKWAVGLAATGLLLSRFGGGGSGGGSERSGRNNSASGGTAPPDAPRLFYVNVKGTTKQGTQFTQIIPGASAGQAYNGNNLQQFRAPDAYASDRQWILSPNALQSLIRVQADLTQQGKSIIVVDAYRTLDQQAQVRQQKPHLATARDEDSNHPKGDAIDLRMYDPAVSRLWDINNTQTWGSQAELAQAMARHGWKQHPSEQWHFDFIG